MENTHTHTHEKVRGGEKVREKGRESPAESFYELLLQVTVSKSWRETFVLIWWNWGCNNCCTFPAGTAAAACYSGAFYNHQNHQSRQNKNKQTNENKLSPELVHIDVNGLMALKPELFTGASWWFMSQTSGLDGGLFALCETKNTNLSIRFCFREKLQQEADEDLLEAEEQRMWRDTKGNEWW